LRRLVRKGHPVYGRRQHAQSVYCPESDQR
jgi:hypothetical protein